MTKEQNINIRRFESVFVILFVSVIAVISSIGFGETTENSKPQGNVQAARSVHLAYDAPEGTSFYTEMTVEQSQPGSYFMACGFSQGYFGIQELNERGDKIVIFSVWDPGAQNNPNEVAEEKRVKVLYQGDGVQVSRFGNEGTGGKSIFPYSWETGKRYRFFVTSKVEQDRTTFSGYFYINETNQWKHLVSFQTITGGKNLSGYYSFIEDFRRDFTSATLVRKARYGNGWVKTPSGCWVALTRARFTADDTPVTNIDAGIIANDFFLQNGSNTKNNTPLLSYINRPIDMDLPESK
jgi:hypothetical protein